MEGEVEEIIVDTRGQKCPQPFIEMVRASMKVSGRVRIKVLTDDEKCLNFIPDYGRDLDYELVSVEEAQGYYIIVMVKSS